MDERTANQIFQLVDDVLHPKLRGLEGVFSGASIILIVIALGPPLVLSTPLISDWAGCTVLAWLRPREVAMQMCDWIAMLFQVLILIAIGGIVFTQKLASEIEKHVSRWGDDLVAAQHQNERDSAAKRLENLSSALQSSDKYEKIIAMIRVIRDTVGDASRLHSRYTWFVAKGIAFNFPGGLYGLLGFLFLVGQIWALSGKIILDHLPVPCQ